MPRLSKALKIKSKIQEKQNEFSTSFEQLKHGKVRLMFQDEAGFGRINKPRYCWCFPGFRPSVPCHHIREYMYAYGAVDPISGDNFFLVLPKCNSDWMNLYLEKLSKEYPDDYIILAMDGARWHTSRTLKIPKNIEIINIPPYTPEMNPIEQIWTEIRRTGFKNECFHTLNDVVNRLCETIINLSNDTVKSITARNWFISCF